MANCVEDFEECSLDGDDACEVCCIGGCALCCWACCWSCWAVPFGTCSQRMLAATYILPPVVIIPYFLTRSLAYYGDFQADYWPWMNLILLSSGWLLSTYLWVVNVYLCCVLIWSFQGVRTGETKNSFNGAPMGSRLCMGGVMIGVACGIGFGIVPRIRTGDAEDFFFVTEFELLRIIAKVGLGCLSGLISVLAFFIIAVGFCRAKVVPRHTRKDDLSPDGQKSGKWGLICWRSHGDDSSM
mmetsp:Transcript_6845/g.10788  ORF Transcript_6845/g.10788 Transcript_6845/m.10788 type:complete len:241 (-) Transcript_6845:353-1075(-)